jgi:hypothetical protein
VLAIRKELTAAQQVAQLNGQNGQQNGEQGPIIEVPQVVATAAKAHGHSNGVGNGHA